jgi:hypothetical protein
MTLKQRKFYDGDLFSFRYGNLALAAGVSQNVVICSDSSNYVLDKIQLQSNAEIFSWQPFVGSVAEYGTGNMVALVNRNSLASNPTKAMIEVDPNLVSPGVAVFDPVDLIAQVRAGQRSYIEASLLGAPFMLKANTCIVMQLKNTHNAAVKYNISGLLFRD